MKWDTGTAHMTTHDLPATWRRKRQATRAVLLGLAAAMLFLPVCCRLEAKTSPARTATPLPARAVTAPPAGSPTPMLSPTAPATPTPSVTRAAPTPTLAPSATPTRTVASSPTPTPTRIPPTVTPTRVPTAVPTKTPEPGEIVYITKTGTKYHADGCSYLSKSKIPITCAEAKARGYTACSVCRPSCP